MNSSAQTSTSPEKSALALFALGILIIVATFSPWIRIFVLNVSGIDTWWGIVTLIAGVASSVYASTLIWPEFLKEQRNLPFKMIALASTIAALMIFSYVGFKLTEVSRQFDDSVSADQSTEDLGLGSEFQQSMDEFAQSLADAFNPSLGLGWYLGTGSTVASIGLLVTRKTPTKLSEPDQSIS